MWRKMGSPVTPGLSLSILDKKFRILQFCLISAYEKDFTPSQNWETRSQIKKKGI